MAHRDLTRDVFRGLCTLEMEFVEASDLPAFAHADLLASSSNGGQLTYADTIYPSFLFLSGGTPTRAWYRSLGLVGLGLCFNTLRTIDLEETMHAARGRHKSIQRRQRRRERIERLERRASRGMADSLLSVGDEHAYNPDDYDYDRDEYSENAIDEGPEDVQDEEEGEPRLIPKFLRLPGVLQRTGLTTLLFRCSYTLLPTWTASWAFPAVVTGIWCAASYLGCKGSWRRPFASPQDSAQTRLDKAVFGIHRLHNPVHDPEGLLTVLPGCLSLWAGYKFNSLLSTPSLAGLSDTQFVGLGLGLAAAGYAVARLLPNHLPLSKRYWTPSYALSTAGVSVLRYALSRFTVAHFPPAVVYTLTCLGQRSLETYFYGAVLRKMLKEYGAATTKEGSAWARAKRYLNRVFGRPWLSDVILVLGVETVLVTAAVYLVQTDTRVIYY